MKKPLSGLNSIWIELVERDDKTISFKNKQYKDKQFLRNNKTSITKKALKEHPHPSTNGKNQLEYGFCAGHSKIGKMLILFVLLLVFYMEKMSVQIVAYYELSLHELLAQLFFDTIIFGSIFSPTSNSFS